jgi:hypothetical protein
MPKNFVSQKTSKVVDLRALKKEALNADADDIETPTFYLKKMPDPPAISQTKTRPPRASARKGKPILLFMIILLILLITATIIGFFIFNKSGSSSESLKLTISAPKNLASGDELKLEVAYENMDKVALTNIEAVVQYPEGFYYNRSNLKPSGSQSNIWKLPDLEPGQGGKVEIVGQLIGKLDEDKEFKAIFNYQPTNINSSFNSELAVKIKINNVLLNVNVDKPTALAPGSLAEFKVRYQNTTDSEMKDLKMGFEMGEDFSLAEAVPSTSQDLLWTIDKLDSRQEGELSLKGKFKEGSNGSAPWSFKVWQSILRDNQKQDRLIYQEDGVIQIAQPDFKASLNLAEGQKLTWGNNVDLKFKVENNGSIKGENAVLKIDFNGNLIDWNKYNNQTQSVRDNNSLTWNKDSGDFGQKLKEIAPNSSLEFDLQIPLKPAPENADALNPEELLFDAVATLTYDSAGKNYTLNSNRYTAFLGSKPQLINEARYYLDSLTAVGLGPLPPIVGQETHYRLYWKIFSGSMGLDNIEVKTTLPKSITWLHAVDQSTNEGQLNYQADSRQVSWNINSLNPNTQVMVSFDVSVIPSADQLNQILILTNPTSLQAKEKNTNLPVTLTNNLLTSELIGDPKSQNQGRVTN